jgi:hypothetical protein
MNGFDWPGQSGILVFSQGFGELLGGGQFSHKRKSKGTHKRSDDSVAVAQKVGGELTSGLPLPPPRLHDGSAPLRGGHFSRV